MWINEVMANPIEESYGLNLEWISSEGMGEEICSVDKECLLVSSSPPSGSTGELILPSGDLISVNDNDYIEIQVTEEEVVSDDWQVNGGNGVEGIELSLEEDGSLALASTSPQPEIYQCPLCPRAFTQRSTLAAHRTSAHVVRKSSGSRRPPSTSKQRRRRKKVSLATWADGAGPQTDVTALFDASSVRFDSTFDHVFIRREDYEEDEMLEDDESSPTPVEDRLEAMDPRRPYACPHCGVAFAREKALASHVMVHVGDSAWECDQCGDMFPSEEALARHAASRHRRHAAPAAATFVCPLCPAAFPWYNQLKRHQRTHQVKEEPFSSTEEMEIGGAESDDGGTSRPHSCHVCNAKFAHAKALTRHILSHAEPPRPLQCPVCTRHFYNRGKLKKHIRSMHESTGIIAECIECHKKFATAAELATHRQVSHGAGRLFPCTQCGKAFTSRSSQQIHVRVHTGEKPYGCRFCWKAFADGGTLRKHERIHTGEKPYVCPVCSKAFNQRVVLREHVRAHHSAGEGGRGGTRMYLCMVCGEQMSESLELCAHLVRHSDENTYKHRLQGTATRKYSRPISGGPPPARAAAAAKVEAAAAAAPPPPAPRPPPAERPPKRRRAKSYAARYAVTADPDDLTDSFPDAPVIVGRRLGRRKQTLASQPPIPITLIHRPVSPVDEPLLDGWDSDMGVSLKLEVRTSDDLTAPSNVESIVPDIKAETAEMVACEICSEMFPGRSDLLKHIEVHI